jgi:hypothetical protein
LPSPPLSPSPESGRGGKRGSPLPLCGRGAGGEGNKKRVSLVHSEPKRCTTNRKGRVYNCPPPLAPQHTPSIPPPTPHQHHTPQHHTTRTLPHPPTTHTRRTHHHRTKNHRPTRTHPTPLPQPHPQPLLPTLPTLLRPRRRLPAPVPPYPPRRPHRHPYTIALDGTTVPRTGAYIPGAHWTPNPHNAPFARGLRKAQRYVMAGWLDDDPNARCVPIYWLPTFSHNSPLRQAPPRAAPKSKAGLPACSPCARGSTPHGRAEQLRQCVGDGRGRPSVGQRWSAEHGLLRAHAQGLALVRACRQDAPVRSGASAGV